MRATAFPVTEVIAEGWALNARVLTDYPNFAETYMPNGRAPAKGEIFRNPLLANTLSRHRRGRPRRLLQGRDRAAHREVHAAPTAATSPPRTSPRITPSGSSRSRRTTAATTSGSCRPTGQGIAALADAQHPRGLRPQDDGLGSAEYLHLFVEAKKLAFDDRARYYADPEFAKVPLTALISKAYAAKRRAADRPGQGGARHTAGDPEARPRATPST